ncbi:MAG: hypothetical protein FD144_153 [Rhodospirillaceae bacterium]|nr:MAG: hypothetical protein FD144_153 [Rhodospirillaceae bacterium]
MRLTRVVEVNQFPEFAILGQLDYLFFLFISCRRVPI